MKYKKIVELPTGVTTKICTSLQGRIKVFFDVDQKFDLPIPLKTFFAEWWEETNDEATDYYMEIKAIDADAALAYVKTENRLARKIKITN